MQLNGPSSTTSNIDSELLSMLEDLQERRQDLGSVKGSALNSKGYSWFPTTDDGSRDMPFFKKKRNVESPKTTAGANGLAQVPKLGLAPLPPLHDFVPPPDVIADALTKSHLHSSNSVAQLLSWGREYFSAFLKNEGVEELLFSWDTAEAFLSKFRQKDANENEMEVEVIVMKELLEKLSGNVDLSKLSDSHDTKDCLEWIRNTHSKIYETLQEQYLPRYIESKFHVKCQVDIFTISDNVSLYDILLNHNAMFYFMEYADQEGKREVLEFWLGASNFSDQFVIGLNCADSTIDFKTAESDAMVLYEKYISLQATHPLGLRDEIRSEVERLICSKEEIVKCFDSAIMEAFAFLHVTCLEEFLKSTLFLTFLSDLIGSLSSAKFQQQAVDSSSVCSSSSVKSFPLSSCSSLTSPSRRQKSKLSLGRVNALGKFEPDTDLEILKNESGIARTVKKLVNYDEKEKAKEELAWQVAAMIVNEVTSVTMGPGEPKLMIQ